MTVSLLHFHHNTKDLAKFGAWHYGESNGNGMCCELGPQTTDTHISQ
jgi:hypothetical protein